MLGLGLWGLHVAACCSLLQPVASAVPYTLERAGWAATVVVEVAARGSCAPGQHQRQLTGSPRLVPGQHQLSISARSASASSASAPGRRNASSATAPGRRQVSISASSTQRKVSIIISSGQRQGSLAGPSCRHQRLQGEAGRGAGGGAEYAKGDVGRCNRCNREAECAPRRVNMQ